jgi:hypothetical protein
MGRKQNDAGFDPPPVVADIARTIDHFELDVADHDATIIPRFRVPQQDRGIPSVLQRLACFFHRKPDHAGDFPVGLAAGSAVGFFAIPARAFLFSSADFQQSPDNWFSPVYFSLPPAHLRGLGVCAHLAELGRGADRPPLDLTALDRLKTGLRDSGADHARCKDHRRRVVGEPDRLSR